MKQSAVTHLTRFFNTILWRLNYNLKEQAVLGRKIPPEAVPLYNDLIEESPYLSDSVMKTSVIKENMLDNAMIRDVLVANPQSAKYDQILSMLENRTVPMPDYMMAQILEGEDTLSPKEILEAERTFWEGKASKAYYKLINNYRADTTSLEDYDSLTWLFLQRNTLSSYYEWAFWHHGTGRYSQRDSVLNLISSSFNFNPEQQANHQDLIAYLEISEAIASDTTEIFAIDSITLTNLQEIFINSFSLSGAFSRNMLIAAGKIAYQEPILLPDTCLKSTKREKYRGVLTPADKSRFTVYPNPANNYFIVEYHLESSPKEGLIIIYDLSGKRNGGFLFSEKQNQMVIPIRDLMPGIYFISLYVEGKLLETKKISIIR
jgi:hypothetical protein